MAREVAAAMVLHDEEVAGVVVPQVVRAAELGEIALDQHLAADGVAAELREAPHPARIGPGARLVHRDRASADAPRGGCADHSLGLREAPDARLEAAPPH